MERIKGGVTAAKGFQAAGVEANVKYKNRKDMAMIVSGVPCRAAGVFTSNVVKAAPVVWDRELIDNSPYIQAVVLRMPARDVRDMHTARKQHRLRRLPYIYPRTRCW